MTLLVRKSWLPEVVEVNVSEDLVPEFRRQQEGVLSDIAALKQEHGLKGAVFRIRDDGLLANKTFAVSINGIRFTGARLERTASLRTELLGALQRLCTKHADAIRFFTELHATAPA